MILIAFVVVESVFTFTVLSTGIFSSQRSKDTVYRGLSVARSSLATRGSFVGFVGKVSTTQTPYKFSFVVASAVGSSRPIDLTLPVRDRRYRDRPGRRFGGCIQAHA